LSTLQTQLTVALEEKAALQVQLDDTTRRLDDQVVQTRVAKDETVAQKWASFQAQAQLTVCEKGNRKVIDKCRETVADKVRPFESKFLVCLRTGQAAPSVRLAGKKEALPEFAEYLDQDDRVTKDWYVLLCDPSLPEAREAPGNAAAEP
jgi:regulator of replication initiation timing